MNARGLFGIQGLDPVLSKMPLQAMRFRIDLSRLNDDEAERETAAQAILAFNREIVRATHDYVAAYKPNSAFYEVLGHWGLWALEQTIAYIRNVAPDVIVILDYKRGDIGPTSQAYADAAFKLYGADAVTWSGYLGMGASAPVLDQPGKMVFVLDKTSNPDSGEFQNSRVSALMAPDGQVYSTLREYRRETGDNRSNTGLKRVSMRNSEFFATRFAKTWSPRSKSAVGLVVGATYPVELAKIRAIAPDTVLLIPGVGTQGGTIADVVRNGVLDRVSTRR